ncbi:hypothetical protein Q4543_01465 [Salipiger sp. 1_MG-2023]|uniref:hypothetical protein n=1 Tax=Salipiger sp. 1_MG-2023 TaxID=3062665 RepID=UPI0026E494D5|nr:hypothetical protein [Salipiger sp. 1_MG-2023]MDO6584173.1 hypothetical protein [Salipiger sp. 1_MG-2023]
MLQSIMQVVIEVPLVFAGDVVQIVSGRKGQVLGVRKPSWDVFRALLPKHSEEALAQAIGSSARGTAQFYHYESMR